MFDFGSVVFYRGLLLQVFSYLLHFLSALQPYSPSPTPPLLLTPTFFRCGLLEEWLSCFGSLFGFSCVGFIGCVVFCSYGLFYPIHPVSFTLIFTPLLNFLFKPNLSGRGLVSMVRNSTYKVGWKERGTNCCVAVQEHQTPFYPEKNGNLPHQSPLRKCYHSIQSRSGNEDMQTNFNGCFPYKFGDF